MQHGSRYLIPLLLSTLMMIASGVGAAVTQDDAGSGGDAGDSQDNALLLPGPGTYDGAFGVNDPADWYRLEDSSPEDAHCALLDVKANAPTDVTLEADGHRVTGRATEDRPLRVSLASPFASHIDHGFEPAKTNVLDSGMREYTFTTDTLSIWELETLSKNDSDDAPERSGSGPLPEDCAFGQLGNGDTSDTYTFDALAGDNIVFSLADTGQQEITMTVLDPAGNIVDGGVDSLLGTSIDTSGTWSVTLSVDGGNTVYYLLGDCRPHCVIDIGS